jgi:hypothetical protein
MDAIGRAFQRMMPHPNVTQRTAANDRTDTCRQHARGTVAGMELNTRTTKQTAGKEADLITLRDAYVAAVNTALEHGREDIAHELAEHYPVERRDIHAVRL